MAFLKKKEKKSKEIASLDTKAKLVSGANQEEESKSMQENSTAQKVPSGI